MTRLLGVDDKTRRQELLRQCGQWTVKELEDQIRVQIGRQRSFAHGGRPSRLPQSRPEALAQLESLLTTLLRWHRGLERAVPSSAASKSLKQTPSRGTTGLDLFPRPLRLELDATMGHLERLREQVEGALAMSADQ
jgi:hypothetical protein